MVLLVIQLPAVAEVVENKKQLELLKKIGVDYIQGFLIKRPEPLDNLLLL